MTEMRCVAKPQKWKKVGVFFFFSMWKFSGPIVNLRTHTQ